MGFNSAIIAGGAVRDTYFGIEINDIDIYVTLDDLKYANTADDVDMLLRNKLITEHDTNILFDLTGDRDDNANYTSVPHIANVWEYLDTTHAPGMTDPRYQIILLDDISPIDFVETQFDIGICMAYCDGQQHHFTSDFLEDANNQTLTVKDHLSQNRFHYCMGHHMPKLQHKFPNFQIVIPDCYK